MASAIGGILASTLKERLERVANVDRVYVDEHRGVCVVCKSGVSADRVRSTLRHVLRSELGPAAEEIALEIVVPADEGSEASTGQGLLTDQSPSGRQRVRFDSIQVEELSNRRMRVRVTLEWNAVAHVGELEGEPGETIELRTAVGACVRAIEQIAGEPLGLRLVGVKRVRAFDAELMVVSLYRHSEAPHKLVGAVLMTDEPHRAAALALLNALNRVLGNFLFTH